MGIEETPGTSTPAMGRRNPSHILDALPQPIAVLEASGAIALLNAACGRETAEGSDPFFAGIEIGDDFLAVCESAARQVDARGIDVTRRLRDAIAGSFEGAVLEYNIPASGGGSHFALHAGRCHPAEGALVVARLEIARRGDWDLARVTEADCTRATTYGGCEGAFAARNPDGFAALADEYGKLLDGAVQQRAYRIPDEVTTHARRIARRFCAQDLGPRDVVEIHRAALLDRGTTSGARLQRAYAEESRMVLLEVMGYLASSYRSRVERPCVQCQAEEDRTR